MRSLATWIITQVELASHKEIITIYWAPQEPSDTRNEILCIPSRCLQTWKVSKSMWHTWIHIYLYRHTGIVSDEMPERRVSEGPTQHCVICPHMPNLRHVEGPFQLPACMSADVLRILCLRGETPLRLMALGDSGIDRTAPSNVLTTPERRGVLLGCATRVLADSSQCGRRKVCA